MSLATAQLVGERRMSQGEAEKRRITQMVTQHPLQLRNGGRSSDHGSDG